MTSLTQALERIHPLLPRRRRAAPAARAGVRRALRGPLRPAREDGLEIYAFTRSTAWVDYEGTQGDIFDHVLAITREFGLDLFQNPTGQDIRRAFPASQ